MKMGMTANDLPEPFSQTPKTEQHQAVRTKEIGDSGGGFHNSDYAKVAERIARETARRETRTKSDEKAEKARTANIDRITEMRHLKYDVDDVADIVQVSVINSEDGTVIRKVPPDEVIAFARRIKEKKESRKRSINISA